MSNRFSTQVKSGGPGQNNEKLTVTILGARPVDGAVSLGVPTHYIHDGITHLENHILFIERNFKNIEWYITAGFEADRVIKKSPQNMHVIENMDYKNTNEAEEVRLVINASKSEHILFLLSYKLFDDTIKNITSQGSCIIFSKETKDIGVTVNNGIVENFSYGINNQWLGQVYLAPKELRIAKNILKDRTRQNIYLFELINLIIDKGGVIRGYENIN